MLCQLSGQKIKCLRVSFINIVTYYEKKNTRKLKILFAETVSF